MQAATTLNPQLFLSVLFAGEEKRSQNFQKNKYIFDWQIKNVPQTCVVVVYFIYHKTCNFLRIRGGMKEHSCICWALVFF